MHYIFYILNGGIFILYNSDGDFQWASIAALVSFIAAIISIWGTKRNISANLKAKSRIEWIQEVKEITSELIKSISMYIESDHNLTQELDSWHVLQKNIYLLMLQFGPDETYEEKFFCAFNKADNEISFSPNFYSKIRDSRSNQGKNNLLVSYLESILDYVKYNSPQRKNAIINKNIDKLYNAYNKRYLVLYINEDVNDLSKEKLSNIDYFKENIEKFFQYIDIGIFHFEDEGIEDESFESDEELETLVREIRVLKNVKEEYFVYLDDLTEILRLYLKIEWDKAKQGK